MTKHNTTSKIFMIVWLLVLIHIIPLAIMFVIGFYKSTGFYKSIGWM